MSSDKVQEPMKTDPSIVNGFHNCMKRKLSEVNEDKLSPDFTLTVKL